MNWPEDYSDRDGLVDYIQKRFDVGHSTAIRLADWILSENFLQLIGS